MRGIYKIECKANGKVYIGQSNDVGRRVITHKSRLKGNYHDNEHLQWAWNKYGAESFILKIIEECTEDVIDDRERYWINYYNSTNRDYGFNRESGGHINKTTSEETRQKLSEACKGKIHSEEARKKMSEAAKGNKNWLGKTHTEESKRKTGEGIKKPVTQEMVEDSFSLTQREWCAKHMYSNKVWMRLRKEYKQTA